MKLFKNVPLRDLENILKLGILAISETGNNNWEEGKRANNSTNQVYLFSPISKFNSFPKSYGVALLEVDSEAVKNEIDKNDYHSNDYIEYVSNNVDVNKITNIYIPKIFESRVKSMLPEEIFEKIKFVKMKATHYDDRELTQEELNNFGETANIEDDFNYFRGKKIEMGLFAPKTIMFDIYNIEYEI